MAFGGKAKPVKDESSKEEKATQALKFHTAKERFGRVGQKDKSWETKKK